MTFPIGVLINVVAVLVSGFLGGLVGNKLDKKICDALSALMGFVALAIGIVLIVKVKTLGAVVLSLVLGTILGTILKLDDRVSILFSKLNKKIFKNETDEEKASSFNTILVLCCVSGTGVFGAINEGITGDSTILICKAIMDFVTVFIFASYLGKYCSLISIPQLLIELSLFLIASLVGPIINDEIMKGDFSAVGGIIELIIAFRILKVTKFKVIDALPAIVLVFPITYFWNILF